MSLLVVVPGFGRPFREKKWGILESNLRRVRSYPWRRLEVHVCAYDAEPPELPPWFPACAPFVRVHHGPGVLAQFLVRHVPPLRTAGFDYVLILLDDVELTESVDWGAMMRHMAFFHLDVASPALTLDSVHVYTYMLHAPALNDSIKVVPGCELFCYFMTQGAYARYYAHLDGVRNPWMWGLDLALERHVGLRVGVFNAMQMRHHLRTGAGKEGPGAPDPRRGFEALLERYGETEASLAAQPAVRYVLFPIPSAPPICAPPQPGT